MPVIAQEWKLIAREPAPLAKKVRAANRNNLIKELKEQGHLTLLSTGKLTAVEFINTAIHSKVYTDDLVECLRIHEDSKLCQQLILKDLIQKLRALKIIDDVAVLILKAHIEENKPQLQWLKHKQIDLPSYYNTVAQVEKFYLKNQTEIYATILSQKNFKKKVSIWGFITPRQELYLHYNFIEIKLMAQILIKAQARILAHSAFIAWDFDGDGVLDEQFKTPDSWKYDMALNILDLTIKQETVSQGILANQNISKQHLLMASSELGLMNEAMIQEIMKLPDFKKPKSGKTEMYLRALWVVGKTALVLIPGGVYFILPIVIIETVIENKMKQKEDKPRVF